MHTGRVYVSCFNAVFHTINIILGTVLCYQTVNSLLNDHSFNCSF